MKSKQPDVPSFQTDSYDLSKTTQKIKLTEVYNNHRRYDINTNDLFIAHFNTIPNYFREDGLRSLEAHTWFIKNYEDEVIDVYYNKRYFKGNKEAEYEDVFYFLYEDTIVNFDMNQDVVRVLFRKTELSKINEIMNGLKKFKTLVKDKAHISLLVHSRDGLGLRTLDITKPKLELMDNYNDDFIQVHEIILKRLTTKKDKGLVLLHGKPGTGKTSYIRYLITKLKKRVIFLPPDMATALTNPNLVPIFIENPDSIFVIEDAENIVIDRERNGNSSVSALLNISDGLLSDCLNIQIICSFNTDVSKIDNALLRKGRLIATYDFQDLKVEKANQLSKKLGFDSEFKSAMPLSMIYNQDEENYFEPRKLTSIGFQTNNVG